MYLSDLQRALYSEINLSAMSILKMFLEFRKCQSQYSQSIFVKKRSVLVNSVLSREKKKGPKCMQSQT